MKPSRVEWSCETHKILGRVGGELFVAIISEQTGYRVIILRDGVPTKWFGTLAAARHFAETWGRDGREEAA